MTLIVSDASPLHYLALIGEVNLLSALYGRVIIPRKVFEELQQPNTPLAVKTFASSPPVWLEVRDVTTPIYGSLFHLDRGEQEAITLALEIQADTLLIDEAKGGMRLNVAALKSSAHSAFCTLPLTLGCAIFKRYLTAYERRIFERLKPYTNTSCNDSRIGEQHLSSDSI